MLYEVITRSSPCCAGAGTARRSAHSVQRPRITSYNVCYTKLLRITSVDPESRIVGLGGGAFVDRYVFPHGELPHLMLVVAQMGAQKLEVMDVETLRLHYAKTLSYNFV